LWNIAGGPQKSIDFISKLHPYLAKENKERKLLSTCPLVVEFRFEAMLCSNLGNENSDAGHIKQPRGLQVPPWFKQIATGKNYGSKKEGSVFPIEVP